MKHKNILTFVLLICIGTITCSCTKKKNNLIIRGEQTISMNKPKVLPQLDTTKAIPPRFEDMDKAMWTTPVDSCTIPIDINGLEVGKSYPLEELIRVWGDFTQTDYWKKRGKYLWENNEVININIKTGVHNSGFKYSKQWGFYGFTLYTPRFTIYDGLISVGKSVELFNTLGCGKLTGSDGSYRFYTNNNPRVHMFYINTDNKGIITCISFTTYDISGYYEEDGYAL